MSQIACKLSPSPSPRMTNIWSAAFFIFSRYAYTIFLRGKVENTTFAIKFFPPQVCNILFLYETQAPQIGARSSLRRYINERYSIKRLSPIIKGRTRQYRIEAKRTTSEHEMDKIYCHWLTKSRWCPLLAQCA